MAEIEIICGDCLEVMKTFKDNQFDLVLTDFPYNEVNRNSNGLRELDKGGADILVHNYIDITYKIARVSNGSVYMFCGTEQVSCIRKTLVNCGYSTRHCIWQKTNPSPMNGEYIWLSAIENCIYGKRKNATFKRFCESPVWLYPCGKSKIHPTQKPIELFKYLIESSSNEGDTVLDPRAFNK